MHLHVLLQVIGVREATATQIADVRPFSAVHSYVSLQLRRRPVRLATDGAVQRCITAAVLEHMQLHFSNENELLGAESAHVARGHLMHCKSAVT